MRIGVLGAGWAGSVHAEMYARMDDVELAGKADPALLSAAAARGGLQMALAAKDALECGKPVTLA
ncbi:MAG: hypothetical protein FJ026_11680 [Chloroflexi bacterium]|nr:hypothetical protein [Chloroflexota bacterium]